MSAWETPSFSEIDMSAEIGGYQGEDPERQNGPDDAPDLAAPQQRVMREGS